MSYSSSPIGMAQAVKIRYAVFESKRWRAFAASSTPVARIPNIQIGGRRQFG
jgi:hypothetical protein